MGILDSLLVGSISFGRNSIGIVVRPYETYRRIVDRGSGWELVYIGLSCALYFALASLVKVAEFRPFVLTRQFVFLGGGALVGFVFVVAALWAVGRLMGGKGEVGKLALAWGYTLLPTTLWFLSTSLLYVVLPPPRTQGPLGVAFSLVFLTFSAALLWWKVTLAYLSVRFGLKLDLARIVAIFAFVSPVLALYSLAMYRLGIFKVPFL